MIFDLSVAKNKINNESTKQTDLIKIYCKIMVSKPSTGQCC